MAIVSTYDELCGIAGYTRAVEEQLRADADIEVMDLDQYLLRSPHRRVQKLADTHIKEIAHKLASFDAVNIQLEYGTLGRTQSQIIRRFRRLAKAAPKLSVTFHTILSEDGGTWSDIWRLVAAGKIGAAFLAIGSARRTRALSSATYGILRSLQWRKPVSAIVHTRRDMRLLRDVWRISDVQSHPLSFIGSEKAAAIRATTSRESFPILRNVPPAAKLIGTFGFLSPYKGFETALQAMNYLPEDHHLLIFGGVHPQAIKRETACDPYILRLLSEANVGRTMFEGKPGDPKSSMSLNITLENGATNQILSRHPKDLQGRVHFMGVLGDDEFAGAMAVCDSVVVPYLEVGQSSSGPISIALDMGCRVIASRTAAFLQLSRFHPGGIEFFDIGNFLELAEILAADPPNDPRSRTLNFNVTTNAEVYMRSFRKNTSSVAGRIVRSAVKGLS